VEHNFEEMDPIMMSEILTTEIGKMVAESVGAGFAGEEHPLDALRGALTASDENDPRLNRVDWDQAKAAAPTAEKDAEGNPRVSLADVTGAAAYYARLLNRLVSNGVMDGDRMMLAFMKTFGKGMVTLARQIMFPQAMFFIRDLNNHGVNMAVAAGTLVPIPGGEEGAYAVREDLLEGDIPADAADGPWGLSKEQFLMVDFPNGEDVYDTIMENVKRADACILEG